MEDILTMCSISRRKTLSSVMSYLATGSMIGIPVLEFLGSCSNTMVTSMKRDTISWLPDGKGGNK